MRLSVLLVVLMAAGAASAQAPSPEREPFPATLTPPPLVSAPEDDEAQARAASAESSTAETPPAEGFLVRDTPVRAKLLTRYERDEHFMSRVGMEVLGGAAGGFVGGGLGFLAGTALGAATVGCEFASCVISGLVGGAVGVAMALPAGTYFGAHLFEGQGTYAAALVGSLLGWGVAGLGLGVLSATTSVSETVGYALLALPVLGASLAYEFSHSAQLGQGQRPRPDAPRVVPVAGFTTSGARLGLTGSF